MWFVYKVSKYFKLFQLQREKQVHREKKNFNKVPLFITSQETIKIIKLKTINPEGEKEEQKMVKKKRKIGERKRSEEKLYKKEKKKKEEENKEEGREAEAK